MEPDVSKLVVAGKTNRFGNYKKVPKQLASGDRLFLWESSPSLRVVGLAAVTNAEAGESRSGRHLFQIQYLTNYIAHPPVIEELRQIPLLNGAAFLKGGAGGFIPLLLEQAEILLGILCVWNPTLGLERVWGDLKPNEPER